MDPHALIDTTFSPGLPAPFWLIEVLKVAGFSLHLVPMNLWYAGVVLAMILALGGGVYGKRFSGRLMVQMPVIIAMGVNFGIVPLLFIQVAYAKFFYPATVLMAWFWFSIILLLIAAYYGVYVYAFAVRGEAKGKPLSRRQRAAGWLSAAAFLTIGFFFANGMSLLANVKDWPQLWQDHSFAGAALGTALNVGDPSFWPRWLMLFGLALTTTGAWVAFDAGWFAGREGDDYRRWAPAFAWKLYTLGMIWFAVAGSWYAFGTWPPEVRDRLLAWPLVMHTVVTGLSPGLAWLLLNYAWRRGEPIGRGLASLVGLAQFGALALNAVSRQMKQNLQVQSYFDASAQPLDVQWSPLIVFLVLTVFGVGLVVWMIAQVAKLPPSDDHTIGCSSQPLSRA